MTEKYSLNFWPPVTLPHLAPVPCNGWQSGKLESHLHRLVEHKLGSNDIIHKSDFYGILNSQHRPQLQKHIEEVTARN